jgi:DNA polymerase-1
VNPIALDLETTGLDPIKDKIRLVIIKFTPHTSPRVFDVFDAEEEHAARMAITSHLQAGGLVIGQNLKFDQKFLAHHWGMWLPNIFDTYRMSNILYAGKDGYKHDLYSIYKRELDLDPPTEDLGGSDWSGTLTKEQIRYAASDVEQMFTLYAVMSSKLARLGLIRCSRIENEVVPAEAALELAGFPIDWGRWKTQCKNNITTKINSGGWLKGRLPNPIRQANLFGEEPWNLDSNQQLAEALRLDGHPLPDTSEQSLSGISDEKLRDELLTYRGASQAVKSFGYEYASNIHYMTGRIHPWYFPFTAAGRYSCRKPNLQQIPRDGAFRRCFRPPDDSVFVVSDYSQIELRIAAEVSGDKELIRAYEACEDVHIKTAKALVGREDKAARQIAKSANFGLLYGAGAETLSVYARTNYGVDMSVAEAEAHRETFFSLYSGVREWQRRAGNSKSKYTKTLAGRIRWVGEDMYTERLNSPVQGTGADGLKTAMRLVWERLVRPGLADMVNVVHDEIVMEAKTDRGPEVKEALEKAMVDGMQPLLRRVPVLAEAKVANSWADK